jgi:hypothetical protein
MQPFEMMLLALRPLQLNCNCNGTTALPNQQLPSAPSAPSANATSANATAAGNATMAANATSANATSTNATAATTFQASAQAQGQALTLEKICGATCSANLCNDTCLRVFVAENATDATNANDIQAPTPSPSPAVTLHARSLMSCVCRVVWCCVCVLCGVVCRFSTLR